MAQKRMIHRRVTSSSKMHALTGKNIARFVYTALLPYADKAGRLNVNPMGLKGTTFEGFEYTVEDITEALHDLASVGLIVLYSNGGHKLLAEYARFGTFNSPHPKEPESDFPGPSDSGSVVVAGSGNLPGNDREEPVQGSTPTPTNTESPTRTPVDEIDSSEERMARAFETGKPQANEEHRVRAEVRRLAGQKFAQKHERDLTSWTRWSNADLQRAWDHAKPDYWPGERHKQRAWIFADLLNEERSMPTPYVDTAAEAREYARQKVEAMKRERGLIN